MVQHIVNVSHLMGGNHNRPLVRHARGDELTELALRHDVQSVGRFVHQQQRGMRGERKTHEHFLLLPHRQPTQMNVPIHLEQMQVGHHVLLAEVGIERAVQLHKLNQRNGRQIKFLGKSDNTSGFLRP